MVVRPATAGQITFYLLFLKRKEFTNKKQKIKCLFKKIAE